MHLTRRGALVVGAGSLLAADLRLALAGATHSAEDEIARFTAGAEPVPGGLRLIAPALAENGLNVPVEIEAPGAEAVLLLVPRNPSVRAAEIRFGPLAARARVATRIRLAESQEIVAVARLAAGRYAIARTHVDVTMSGCIT